jgi:predicted RNase H-like nuclease
VPLCPIMIKTSEDPWFAGVDGCKGGWLAVFVRSDCSETRVWPKVLQQFEALLIGPAAPAIIAVDIPIGLPDCSEYKGRGPERAVRLHLRKRRSSVFRVPSRSAVYAGVDSTILDDKARYRRACGVARATSIDGKAFGKQSFYLFPKIVQVDTLLLTRKSLKRRIFETHPEMAFCSLNGGTELDYPKKVKGRCYEPGLELRERLLIKEGFPAAVVKGTPPKGADRDDLLDALACAAIARRIHLGCAEPFPNPYKRDAFGLPMAIWA